MNKHPMEHPNYKSVEDRRSSTGHTHREIADAMKRARKLIKKGVHDLMDACLYLTVWNREHGCALDRQNRRNNGQTVKKCEKVKAPVYGPSLIAMRKRWAKKARKP